MNRISKIIIGIVIVLSSYHSAVSQGCSDAGVCSFESHTMEGSKRSTVGVGGGIGLADGGVFVNTFSITGNIYLTDDISIAAMLPIVNTFGGDFGAGGIGDPFAALNFNLMEDGESGLDLLIGGRFAVGATDIDTDEGKPLPMQYQPGLGTNDLITRITYFWEEWSFALGYQHPFGINDNEYYVGNLGIEEEEDKFWSSNSLDRGADLSFRVDYAIKGNETTYRVGLLPIYRLQESTINQFETWPGDWPDTEKRISVEGSSGLTVNITGGFATQLSDDWMFGLDVGFPVLVRENRPDGLTRAFQLNASFDYLLD